MSMYLHRLLRLYTAALVVFLSPAAFSAPPATLVQAKVLLKTGVYFDQNKAGASGTLYCGCSWRWVGKSGGRVDHAGCGYETRTQTERSKRTEWEHIVTAYALGHQRQCWQQGGRRNCRATDPVFRAMEADMHNLAVVVGEVNADRSNYSMGMVAGEQQLYGQCLSKADFRRRIFEPRDEAKGLVARVHFYMHDRYDLSMSRAQQQLFMAWNRQHPPSDWELERNRRIKAITGYGNEFVTGERSWELGHKNRGDGLPADAAEETVQKQLSSEPFSWLKTLGDLLREALLPSVE